MRIAITLAVLLSGLSCAAAKPSLRTADLLVRQACEGLAQAVAARTGADAERIVAATCAVEGVTRTMREMLLAAQIEAAKASGVPVPDINSGFLEREEPYTESTAE